MVPMLIPKETIEKLNEYLSIRIGRKIAFKEIREFKNGDVLHVYTDKYSENMGIFSFAMKDYNFELDIVKNRKYKSSDDPYMYGRTYMFWTHKNGGTNGFPIGITFLFDTEFNFVEK
jgi:hypothetical protein